MLIKENAMYYRKFLSSPYIFIEPSMFQIPVIENSNVGYLVPLEKIIDFSESVSMDINSTIRYLATAHNLAEEDMFYTVNETSVLLDKALYEDFILSNKDRVFIQPEYIPPQVQEVLDECLEELLLETEGEFKKTPSDMYVITRHGDISDNIDNNYTFRKQADEGIDNDFKEYSKLQGFGKGSKEDFENQRDALVGQINWLANTQHITRQQQFGVGKDLHMGDFSKKPSQYNMYAIPIKDAQRNAQGYSDAIDEYEKKGTTGNKDLDEEIRKMGFIRKILLKISKASLNSWQGMTRNMSDSLSDFADHLSKDQYPRSFLAKCISWFRNLYRKLMFKYESGMSQMKDASEFQKTLIDKSSGKFKRIWATVKYMGKNILKVIIGKVLRIIDILAQKLQNFSDKASDKIHGWLGMKKNGEGE